MEKDLLCCVWFFISDKVVLLFKTFYIPVGGGEVLLYGIFFETRESLDALINVFYEMFDPFLLWVILLIVLFSYIWYSYEIERSWQNEIINSDKIIKLNL